MRTSRDAEGGQKPGRNDPCPCGSGRKYKVCCGAVTSTHGARSLVRIEPVDARALQAALSQAARARADGRAGEAIAALFHAVSLDPQNAALHLELGTLLLGSGRPRDALSSIDRAIGLEPGAAQAHVRRGSALEQLGRFKEAIEAYRHATSLAPRLVEAYVRLGTVLHLGARNGFVLEVKHANTSGLPFKIETVNVQDLRAAAAKSFRRAATLEPKPALSRLFGAHALIAEGAIQEAQAALQQVIALEPGNVSAHAQLGKILSESGQSQEAFAAFEKVLQLDPRAVGCYYDLVRVRRLRETDRPLLHRMLEVMQRDDLQDIHRIMLRLAVGKAYDDLDEPEQAIRHFMVANRLKGRVLPLDRDLITRRVDWQIRTFTKEFFARNTGAGSPDRTPILVLGMPRAGTTLVESVLACHSQVGAGQELAFWNQQGRKMMEAGAVPAAESLREIADTYLALLRFISKAPRVTDKKPQNFMWAGLVRLVFPEARIIHCRRNPLDTCVSVLANFFAPQPDFSTEPNDLVFYYREYERVMAHWRTVLPADRFVEVDYESLVADPEPAIRRILEFCDLGWEETCVHPELSKRNVSTASLWQVRQPIFKGSVGRWRRYEPWLAELRALGPQFDGEPVHQAVRGKTIEPLGKEASV